MPFLADPSPPSIFVGRMGYPKVFAGPLISLNRENPKEMDNPPSWINKTISEIINFRTSLVRGTFKTSVFMAPTPDKMLSTIQEIALSFSPVDVEAEFRRLSGNTIRFDDVLMPQGLSGEVKKIQIIDNPDIPARVDRIVEDYDINVTGALTELWRHEITTHDMQRLLSAGLLGRKRERKMVPTRWSITATHDILGKELIKKILHYPQIDSIKIFSFEHYGNHFEILLLPSQFFFEIVEIWMKNSLWSPGHLIIEADRERGGRKKSYSPLGGGYYAARLPVLEYMYSSGIQGGAIVIREISPSYWAPLGVWVVEEGVRQAMKNRWEEAEDLNRALTSIERRIKTPRTAWLPSLTMLAEFKEQRRLSDFLKGS